MSETTTSAPRDSRAERPRFPAPKLSEEAKTFVLHQLAEFSGPTLISRRLNEQYGISVDNTAISYYRDNARWAKEIDRIREKMDAEYMIRLPICNRYWRMKKRQELIERALSGKPTRDGLSVARGLLQDAAKELGQWDEKTGSGPVNVNVNLLQHVTQLSPDAALEYARTGKLPPGQWAKDAGSAPVNRAISGESESVSTKVPGEPDA